MGPDAASSHSGSRHPVQDLVGQLAGLGIERDLAQLYVELSRRGPLSASEIAAALRINRTRAHRLARRLNEEGLAEATLTHPVRYAALAPPRLFDALELRHQARLDRVEHVRADIEPMLDALGADEPPEIGVAAFRLVQGRERGYQLSLEMATAALNEVLIVNTHAAAMDHAHFLGLWQTMASSASGSSVKRVIVRDDAPALSRLRNIPEIERFEVRLLDTDECLQFCIADHAQLLALAVMSPEQTVRSREDVAIWTEAPALIGAHARLFEQLWREARPADATYLG